jgi:hypothetical protein
MQLNSLICISKNKESYILRCNADDIEWLPGQLVQSKVSGKLRTVRMLKASGATKKPQKKSVNT